MKFLNLTQPLFGIQSNDMYNIFIPLISQATKCKISISNFKYGNSRAKSIGLQKMLEKNVC